jgi:CBS domain-containing protein
VTRPRPAYEVQHSAISIPELTTIADAIREMNEKRISCVLLSNPDRRVTGILTERDVIRRLTLLDIEDKLQRPVITIATRDVLFADADNLHESVVRLHFEKNVRHFPVLRGDEPLLDDVVGIVTVTDIIRHYLRLELAAEAKAKAAEREPRPPRPLSVICQSPKQMELYQRSFGSAGFVPTWIDDPDKFFRDHQDGEPPLVFDFDGYPKAALSRLVVQAQKYRGHLILTVSNPAVVNLFRPYLDKRRQTIAMKPFDVEYLAWLLTSKWAGAGR